MSRKKLTARDMRIKNLMLSGCSRNQVASILKVNTSSVYKAVERLVDYKELQWVEGTVSPAIYIDPKDPRYQSPKGDCDGKSGNRGELAAAFHHPGAVGTPSQGGDDCGSDTNDGSPEQPVISSDRICPEGYAAAHLNGLVKMTVEEVGTFESLRFNDRIVGEWASEPSELNGSRQWRGQLDLFGQRMTFSSGRASAPATGSSTSTRRGCSLTSPATTGTTSPASSSGALMPYRPYWRGTAGSSPSRR